MAIRNRLIVRKELVKSDIDNFYLAYAGSAPWPDMDDGGIVIPLIKLHDDEYSWAKDSDPEGYDLEAVLERNNRFSNFSHKQQTHRIEFNRYRGTDYRFDEMPEEIEWIKDNCENEWFINYKANGIDPIGTTGIWANGIRMKYILIYSFQNELEALAFKLRFG